MKKYLALFVAPIEAYDKMKEEMQNTSPEEQKGEMEKWTQWMEQNKANIVDNGGGVGSAKRVTGKGEVSDTRNEVGGYMVVQAESAEAAADMFKKSPHIGMENAAIEVMEIMEM